MRSKLEITESMIMSDPDRALSTVLGLRELGVKISVDDFGTGYSSLANLRHLPVNELKITGPSSHRCSRIRAT